MIKKFEDFLNEDLTQGEMMTIINKDIECLNLNDTQVIQMSKDIMVDLFKRNEEKYHNIIEIIKLQNENSIKEGGLKKPRYTNLLYLNRKSESEINVIKDKWLMIKDNNSKRKITIRSFKNNIFHYDIFIDDNNKVIKIDNQWDVNEFPVWVDMFFDIKSLEHHLNKSKEYYIEK